MYCSKCGHEIGKEDVFCPYCGWEISKKVTSDDNHEEHEYKPNCNKVNNTSMSGKKLASIILGSLSLFGVFLVIFAPLSLIVGIIGLILGIVANKKEKNAIGIVLNAISLFLSLTIMLFMGLIIYYGTEYSDDIPGYDVIKEEILGSLEDF